MASETLTRPKIRPQRGGIWGRSLEVPGGTPGTIVIWVSQFAKTIKFCFRIQQRPVLNRWWPKETAPASGTNAGAVAGECVAGRLPRFSECRTVKPVPTKFAFLIKLHFFV
jgi:hypothetical protein